MRRPNIIKKAIYLVFILCIVSVTPVLSSQLDEQAVSFKIGKQEYNVTVQLSTSGCDIWLTGTEMKNLSLMYPGENLFPNVTFDQEGQNFTIAWMQYQPGNIQLFLYNSRTDQTRFLPLDHFKTASPIRTIYHDSSPYLLLFMGNNSDNTDIFAYHLENGGIINITQTPESEKEFQVEDENNRFFIETSTLYNYYRYRIKKRSLKRKITKMMAISHEIKSRVQTRTPEGVNTVVGFGDSITWGTCRMNVNDPEDYYHPEWNYLSQLKESLAEDYGEITTVNLGVPGERASAGVNRIYEDFVDLDAYFCLVMFGTNDVPRIHFDLDATVRDLEYIVTTARDIFGMYPIISTIPPQKDEEHLVPHIQYFIHQTENLNAGIIAMAERNNIAYIDTYTAFFTNENDWEMLLEAYRGNHPSPLGSQVISGLFKEKVLAVPPSLPGEIEKATPTSGHPEGTVQWTAAPEFDFSHYEIEFGYSPESLNRIATTTDNYYTFPLNPMHDPFAPKIYFRIRSVDLDGNTGPFSTIMELEK